MQYLESLFATLAIWGAISAVFCIGAVFADRFPARWIAWLDRKLFGG